MGAGNQFWLELGMGVVITLAGLHQVVFAARYDEAEAARRDARGLRSRYTVRWWQTNNRALGWVTVIVGVGFLLLAWSGRP